MAFAASVNWEVRTTGNDANGGGFDAVSGTPGTDYSQQDTPQITYTDLVIDGTTNTHCTSAGNPFTSAHVGNIINVTSGTGFTVQRVQVMSVAGGVAVVDKSLGTLSSTGGNGKLGGGLLTISAAVALTVTDNVIWIKGTYTITTAINIGAVNNIIYHGYGTTHGDTTQATVTTSTNSINNFNYTAGGYGNCFINLIISSTAGTPGKGLVCNGFGIANGIIYNCVFSGFTVGISYDNYIFNGSIIATEVKTCTTAGIIIGFNSTNIVDCYIHGCGDGISVTGGNSSATQSLVISNCIISANTNGIKIVNSGTLLLFKNTIYGNSADGIHINTGNNPTSFFIMSNIIYGNSAYGFNNVAAFTVNSLVALTYLDLYNAWGANTTADTVNYTKGSTAVTLTGNPFTNAGAGDFSLNSTAGAGAACKGTGWPSAIGPTTSTSIDIGAAQAVAGVSSNQILISL